MLIAPVMDGDTLYGVLQIINNRSNKPFTRLDEDGAQQLCKTLGIAIRQRLQKLAGVNNHLNSTNQHKKATKYDGLVASGLLGQEELTNCI